MPIVTVEAFQGRSIEQKRSLVKDITDAVVKNFNTNPSGVIVIIREMNKENYGHGGLLATDK